MFGEVCCIAGYYTLLAWLPSFFELALGLNVNSSSLLTLIPYIAMTVPTSVSTGTRVKGLGYRFHGDCL